MTDIGTRDARGTALLPTAHRVVRVLDADEGPFEGTLVTSEDGVAVRVDASTLRGWIGWRYSGAEHVAAPIDVIRRRGGHDVLLPWCTDQVLGFLVRRSATGAALKPGECCTLVISLLRGLGEIGDGVEGARTGAWWVTDGGRPVFVFGAGTDAREGAGQIVRRLGEDSADKVLTRALGAIEKGLEKASAQPRIPPRLLEVWEQELLDVAAPQPLDRGSHAPERAREVARAITSQRPVVPRNSQRLRADRRRPSRGILATAAAAVRAGKESFAIAVARIAAVARGRRGREPRVAEDAGRRSRSRRRLFIVAAAVAAVVLAAGMLWPEGGDPGEAADGGTRRAGEPASAASGGAASPASEDSGVGEESEESEETTAADGTRATDDPRADEDPSRSNSSREEDPVAATAALFAMITACRAQADAACSEAVASGAAGVVDELRAVDQGTTVELVDEYGDVAVVRLDVDPAEAEAGEADPQEPAHLMVVLIRTQEKWLVRDVYDVADQP